MVIIGQPDARDVYSLDSSSVKCSRKLVILNGGQRRDRTAAAGLFSQWTEVAWNQRNQLKRKLLAEG
jgi:hypothetical protein